MIANEDALSERRGWCDQFFPFGSLTYRFRNVGLALQLRLNTAANHSASLMTAITEIREASYSNNHRVFEHEEVYINRVLQPLQQYQKPFSQLRVFLYRCQEDPTCISLFPSYYIAFNSLPQHPAPSSVTGMIVFELLLLARFPRDMVPLIAHLTLRQLLRRSQCMYSRLGPVSPSVYVL